jgi:hypothetical protein
MFSGRHLAIASMHKKESVISPLLERSIGVKCILPLQLDTDALGTFSGEIDRYSDPISTVRTKCILGMQESNCDLAVASEGSFGPHPALFFVPAHEEFMMLIDKKNKLEICVRTITQSTNFNHAEIHSQKELNTFIENAQFPSHAIIIKKAKDDLTDLVKGINTHETLQKWYQYFINKYGQFYIETDMRAMHNPTRMGIIHETTLKLIDKLNSTCPICDTPGFGPTDAIKGLPCKLCNAPTNSPLCIIYSCVKCNHKMEKFYPNNKRQEEPMYCDSCNP